MLTYRARVRNELIKWKKNNNNNNNNNNCCFWVDFFYHHTKPKSTYEVLMFLTAQWINITYILSVYCL